MSKLVVIDAGHGGKDSGAAANGIKEKDIALKIAKAIVSKLNSDYKGVSAKLTRSDDTFLELKERTDYANNLKADLLISVHCNAGGGAGGFESFTYNGAYDAPTSAAQNMIHNAIMNRLKAYNVIDRGQKKKDLHMCRESAMTAVLTECLFIDVVSDANKLKRDDVLNSFILGHVEGIASYLGLEAKATEKSNTIPIFVNGVKVATGEVENGVTKVPLRVIAENLNAIVNYDSKTQTVNIVSKIK